MGKNSELDKSTEEKIKAAARAIFHRKGYAATRTREIAEEAGINLALLNYYFRSKEKLFHIIMMESMQDFLKSLISIFNNTDSSLNEKIESLVEAYTERLLAEPDFPMFILSEVRNNPEAFMAGNNLSGQLKESVFMRQIAQSMAQKEPNSLNPVHIIMNLMSLIIFPFISAPMLQGVGQIDQEQYKQLLIERKKLIPAWIESMLQNH